MPSHPVRGGLVLTLLTIALPFAVAQTASQGTPRSTPGGTSGAKIGSSSNSSSAAARTARTAKGPLPDPVLLDGSALEAEKRPEYGMLGEFEMAGDENSKSEKVGGGQNEKPMDGQAQNGADSGSAGAGGQNQGGGQEQQAGAGSEAAGQNESGGKAEGQQVGQLKGENSGGAAGQESSRPQQVALGDSAMQIKPQANVPGVIGNQQQITGKEVPQQYDKNTPAGGKQTPGRGNQGVEKGRVMPAGI